MSLKRHAGTEVELNHPIHSKCCTYSPRGP